MAARLVAMFFLQQNADVASMGIDKEIAAEGMAKRAFRALKYIASIPSYAIQMSSNDINDKNLGAAQSSMKATRKGKFKLTNKEICPDTEVANGIPKDSNLSKKKLPTNSSVCITQNKVTCEVYDIDSCDADNQFAHTEYVEDLYKFYKIVEKSSQVRDYMNSQVEINAEMRANVSYWLIEVHEEYLLRPETLYLAFQIMDSYLSVKTVRGKKLQLIGITSMFIASKYVERRGSPHVAELVSMYRMPYNRSRIPKMEKEILNKINWSLSIPTMYVFLVRFLKAASGDKQMERMTFFFSELALMNYIMIIYKPSMVAASAVYAARCSLRIQPLWTKTLEYHTGFKSNQLVNCATKLLSFYKSEAAEKRMKAKKHSGLHFDDLALNTPFLRILNIIKKTLVGFCKKWLEL